MVKLEGTKTKIDRTFAIVPGNLRGINLLEIVRKYLSLRPTGTPHNRFFINYIKEKCTRQPVGIHKIGNVPSIVAKYLCLPNASSYTGHCFRRSSATALANSGVDIVGIKRHGGWRSSTVAEGYIEECENSKVAVAKKILEGSNVELSTSNIDCAKSIKKSNEPLSLSISGGVVEININYSYN